MSFTLSDRKQWEKGNRNRDRKEGLDDQSLKDIRKSLYEVECYVTCGVAMLLFCVFLVFTYV